MTIISFQHRFESHIYRIEEVMKARLQDYAVYKIGLDVYKEAVVQNAKQCTSGFEIKYFHRDDATVYDSLNIIYHKGRAAKDFIDANNIVVKDVPVVVTAIEDLNFRGNMSGYKIKVKSRGQKRSREEVTWLHLG